MGVRKPEFGNLLAVLRREVPERPTLFEFFLNERLIKRLTGVTEMPQGGMLAGARMVMQAYARAGYDYVTTHAAAFGFPTKAVPHAASRSLNDSAVITDRASFRAYAWQDPRQCDYTWLETLAKEMPAGMKLITHGPNGVLENVIGLVGYEPLCMMLADDPGLAGEVFEAVGSRLVAYYEMCAPRACVGAVISNDDWGFKTQTMLAPADMRKYVFPWHKKIVEVIHGAGKPAILHSCGQLDAVMDDVIDVMKYDAKHSYEDTITPVEEAYEKWGRRIAILGGIDVDYVCRHTPAEVRGRAQAMLERAAKRGGYALGTGNSVPMYVPDENYLAMIGAAVGELGL